MASSESFFRPRPRGWRRYLSRFERWLPKRRNIPEIDTKEVRDRGLVLQLAAKMYDLAHGHGFTTLAQYNNGRYEETTQFELTYGDEGRAHCKIAGREDPAGTKLASVYMEIRDVSAPESITVFNAREIDEDWHPEGAKVEYKFDPTRKSPSNPATFLRRLLQSDVDDVSTAVKYAEEKARIQTIDKKNLTIQVAHAWEVGAPTIDLVL